MSRAIDEAVLAVLREATTDGCNLVLPADLDRPTYVAVSKVLAKAGGRWDRRAKATVFPTDAGQILAQLLGDGKVVDVKAEFQAFYTPPELAENLAQAVNAGDQVLEPSCGAGALIQAALDAGASEVMAYDIRGEVVFQMPKWPRQPDGLSPRVRFEVANFLEVPADESYDVVLMNPPFTRQQDLLHVTHALRFVRPGGRLVSVMGSGSADRGTRVAAEFRALLSGPGIAATGFRELPPGAFRSSGTDVRAVVLSIETRP